MSLYKKWSFSLRTSLVNDIKFTGNWRNPQWKTSSFVQYVKHLLILILNIAGCVSISAFASVVCAPVGVTSSGVGIKIWVFTAGIKNYKSIIKKKKKTHVLLGKVKLNTIEVSILKALIDSYISHDEFVSVNNVLREYNEIKSSV